MVFTFTAGYYWRTRELLRQKIQTDEQLKKREIQLNEAQAIAHVGSWEWDVLNDTITWSDELFRMFDMEPTGFNPTFEAYIQRLDPSQRESTQRLIQNAFETGEDFVFEHIINRKDGRKYVQARGKVIKDETGKTIRMSGTTQDITEQKHSQEKLVSYQNELEKMVEERTAELNQALEREKQAKKVAEAATQAKTQFLANMSHEIRTPMNAILGFSDLLAGENLSLQQKDFLGRIKTNGNQLLQIIDDILDLSKFEAGKIPLQKSDFSLSETVQEVVSSLSSLAYGKGIEIKIEFSTEVPEFVCSDQLRLRQVLTNLVSNAIKFTEKGHVRIFMDFNSVSLSFEVHDTGIGISEEHQKILFQPFMQADGSIVRKFGGTGLGLILSRRIADALGGDLFLKESKVGFGSVFRFQIPAEPLNGLNRLSKDRSSPSEKFENGFDFSQIRVLLAEDSSENEILVRHYLVGTNIQLDSARNGIEALKLASLNPYDLVLMDLQMPELDGLGATRRLRERGFTAPIVALTAHAFLEDRQKAYAAGCTDYLTKPVQCSVLLHTIQKHSRNLAQIEIPTREELSLA